MPVITSYTHSILTLGIVRKPTVWGFITSKYPGIHEIGLPTAVSALLGGCGRGLTGLTGMPSRHKRPVVCEL